MDLVDVPASTQQLDLHQHLDVPHRLIGARRPLEPGQVVVVRDLDGHHRWAAVDGLRFTETETVYDTRHSSRPPIETTSTHEGEGEGWPWVWLIVTAIGVVLAIYFLV